MESSILESPDLFNAARTFLQNTGMFLGSREAEDSLVRLGLLRAAEPESLFRRRCLCRNQARPAPAPCRRPALPTCFPPAAAMNAIYAAFRAVSELQTRPRPHPLGAARLAVSRYHRPAQAVHARSGARPTFICRTFLTLRRSNGCLRKKGDRIAGVFAERRQPIR